MQITIDIDDAWVQSEAERLIREAVSGEIKKQVAALIYENRRGYSRDISIMVSKSWDTTCQSVIDDVIGSDKEIETLVREILGRKVKAVVDKQYKLTAERKALLATSEQIELIKETK